MGTLNTVQRLGVLADVGIGYVTGANDFFHLSAQETQQRRISGEYLQPTVYRSRAFTGLTFTASDWQTALRDGEAGYLLAIESQRDISDSVRQYLAEGEAQGVSQTYKCRTRSPWYRVPHVYQPDAFLSYMSGVTPRLVANKAGVVAPNNLHVVRLHPLTSLRSQALAALWYTSLTRLSAELEGHPLGGGLLKLEPTEAKNILLAMPTASLEVLDELAVELDMQVREGDEVGAQRRADAVILQKQLGFSPQDCDLLRCAAEILRQRRYNRRSKG